jgi:hypothetical protein
VFGLRVKRDAHVPRPARWTCRSMLARRVVISTITLGLIASAESGAQSTAVLRRLSSIPAGSTRADQNRYESEAVGQSAAPDDSAWAWLGLRDSERIAQDVVRLHTSADPSLVGTASAQGAGLTVTNNGNEASVQLNLCDYVRSLCQPQHSGLKLSVVASSINTTEVSISGITGRSRARLEYLTNAINLSGWQFTYGGSTVVAMPEYRWRDTVAAGTLVSEQRVELSIAGQLTLYRSAETLFLALLEHARVNAAAPVTTVCVPVAPSSATPLRCASSSEAPPTSRATTAAGVVIGRRIKRLNARAELLHRLSDEPDLRGRAVLSLPVWMPVKPSGNSPSLGLRPTWQAGAKPRFSLIVGIVNW